MLPLQAAVPTHAKLTGTMFWVGAVMAFIPFAVVGVVAGFLLWNRRQRARSQDQETKAPPA